MIPARYLSNLGDYDDITIGDVPVKVKYVDNADVINIDGVLPSKGSLFALDFKRVSSTSSSSKRSYDLLILCWYEVFYSLQGPNTVSYSALVINLGYMDNVAPQKLRELLVDAGKCFVTPTTIPSEYKWMRSVEIGEVAARKRKKPELIDSGLEALAREFGVPYEGSKTKEIQVDQKFMKVLTPAQVKTAITDAYTCRRVASMLL